MQRMLRAVILSAAVAASSLVATVRAQTPAATAPQAADVPVKSVVLYSSGVGYFEHFGTVHGNARTELRFKADQINDILKSLVLQDLDKGAVSTVTYPSQDPLGKALKSFQVDISGNPALSSILTTLRGARVTITLQGEKLSGSILGVEMRQKPGGKDQPIVVPVLNILTGADIRAVELEQVHDLQLDDPQLQDELHKALAAVVQARDQDKKPVTINFTGDGDHRVRIGYVVETPVWKTSYRLIFPSDSQHKPHLQGWAIVENQTDSDWNNVQLSLVSGRPISFIQDLYQPLYLARPVVQPELFASLRPQTYAAGIKQKDEAQSLLRERAEDKAVNGPRAARRLGGAGGAPGLSAAAAPMPLIDAVSSVTSLASAAQLGELFQYTVSFPVSLSRHQSAMIPIITSDVDAERLSIYNASVLPKNPLNGARLKNTTGDHLLQGPVTVLESGSYAGDARINDVPPTQQRLLSYGVDLQMLVDSTSSREDSSIQSGRIVKGVLEITRKQVFTQEYRADNKAKQAKTLVVEHPRRQGWHLSETSAPVETTDALYRFQVAVPPAKATTLTVHEEIVQGESFAILPADLGQLDFYSRTGQIPQDVRNSLIQAMQLKSAMVDTQRQIDEWANRLNALTAEQGRIRENLKTVPSNSEYYNRLLRKLDDQESEIEKLQRDTVELNKKLQTQRQALEAYLTNLSVG